MPTPVYIATYVDVQPPWTTQGIQLIHEYREAGRRGQGNLSIDVVQEISRTNRFAIIEVWKDQSSFEEHQTSSAIAQLWARPAKINNSPSDRRLHLGFSNDASPAAKSADAISVVTHVDVPPPANAFDSHQMTAHTRKFRESLGPILGAPYDERLYKAVP